MIGKRKRGAAVVSPQKTADTEESDSSGTGSAHDVFRRYFESQFKPLEPQPSQVLHNANEMKTDDASEEDDADTDSNWSGLSDAENGHHEVEVVEHTYSHSSKDPFLDKKARKAFMNAKPPPLDTLAASAKTTSRKRDAATDDDDEQDNTDAQDLKNDLALQRLLRESHLLESATELAPTGKNRHKAIDLRVQALGSKTSIFKQEKMPDSHRRGIKLKAAHKEEKRRREARENGIVLEKPTFKAKATSTKRRDRGIGAPAVGKFAGGTLNLNKRDLTHVQGFQKKGGLKGKGRGKSKGRR